MRASGLHYLDTKANLGVPLVNTVADNRSKYTNDDYLFAVQARELQVKIGWPSLKDFLKNNSRKPGELTLEQTKEALSYLMFLKRKHGGKIKKRGCADGRKERAYTAKKDATSPTVGTEAVFLTSVIDAMENREEAVFESFGSSLP